MNTEGKSEEINILMAFIVLLTFKTYVYKKLGHLWKTYYMLQI